MPLEEKILGFVICAKMMEVYLIVGKKKIEFNLAFYLYTWILKFLLKFRPVVVDFDLVFFNFDFDSAGSRAEWKILYSLAKDEDGFLQKDTVKSVYDGSLFYKLTQNTQKTRS